MHFYQKNLVLYNIYAILIHMKKRDELNQPVTIGDFHEFTDGFNDALEAALDERVNTILTAVDGIAKNVITIKDEQAAGTNRHDQIYKKLLNHEQRIKSLEQQPGLS